MVAPMIPGRPMAGITAGNPDFINTQRRISQLDSSPNPQQDQLAQYLVMLTQQGKVGTPEYFMAAGEYAERQKTRQEAQAKQPDQPKVIQRLIADAAQETAMNRGVAAVPAPNVGGYAPGGIVAFEDGGTVKRYQFGGVGRSGLSPEELETNRLREEIRRRYAFTTSPLGTFTPTSASGVKAFQEKRAGLQDLLGALPNLNREQLEQLNISLQAMDKQAPTFAQAVSGPGTTGDPNIATPGDLKRFEKQQGSPYMNAPAEATPYIPRTMQLSNVAAAPAAATLESALTEAEGIVSPKGSRTLTAAERLDEMKEYMKAAGFDADKFYKEQREDLEKKKAETKEDRREAANMRLIEAGLGILGGESPFAFVNIGKGASPAIKGFADDIKDIRKLTREYDKAIRDINVAEQSGKREMGLAALKRSQDLSDKLEERKFDLAGRIYSAKVQKEIAGMPGAEERLISRFSDPKFAELAEKAYKARGAGRGGASAISDIIEDYAKNPAKLEMLKDMNPALYNYVKAQLTGMAIPSAVSSPTGKIRE